MTFDFQVHHQIVLQVAENVAQNESFVLSKATPASKVSPFDGICDSFDPYVMVQDTHMHAINIRGSC